MGVRDSFLSVLVHAGKYEMNVTFGGSKELHINARTHTHISKMSC